MKSPQTKDKSKKKHSTPAKKSTSTDARLEAMDQKWSEGFSCLGALFLSKSMEKSDPTFQTLKMSAKSPPAGAVKVSELFIPPKPADRPVMATDEACLEAQLTDPQLSALIIRPISLQPTRPLLPYLSSQARLVYTLPRTLAWIWTQILILIWSTDPPVCLMRKGNCLIRIKTSLLQTPTRLFQKSRHTGKLYMASGPSWGGPPYRTWIIHLLLQMITLSRHPKSSLRAGLVSSCPVMNGKCVGKWICSM